MKNPISIDKMKFKIKYGLEADDIVTLDVSAKTNLGLLKISINFSEIRLIDGEGDKMSINNINIFHHIYTPDFGMASSGVAYERFVKSLKTQAPRILKAWYKENYKHIVKNLKNAPFGATN